MGGINPRISRSCRSREEARVSSSNGCRIRQTDARYPHAISFPWTSYRGEIDVYRAIFFSFCLHPINDGESTIRIYERNPELITERNNCDRSVDWWINSNSGNYDGKKWVTDRWPVVGLIGAVRRMPGKRCRIITSLASAMWRCLNGDIFT